MRLRQGLKRESFKAPLIRLIVSLAVSSLAHAFLIYLAQNPRPANLNTRQRNPVQDSQMPNSVAFHVVNEKNNSQPAPHETQSAAASRSKRKPSLKKIGQISKKLSSPRTTHQPARSPHTPSRKNHDTESVAPSQMIPAPYSVSKTRQALLLTDGYVHPIYPRRAKMRREEGSVLFEVKVKGGDVVILKILESSGHEELNEAAREAITRWRYRPIDLTYTQRVTFQLK